MHLVCKCGKVLSNSVVPNDIQIWAYTDREWDEIINMGKIDTINIPHPKYDIWRCAICERIYVFEKDNGKAIRIYKLEEE